MADSPQNAAGDPVQSGAAAAGASPEPASGLEPGETLDRIAATLASAPPTLAGAFAEAMSFGLDNAMFSQQFDGGIAGTMLDEICARLLKAAASAAGSEEAGSGPLPGAPARPGEDPSPAGGRAEPRAPDPAAAESDPLSDAAPATRPNPAALAFAQTAAIIIQDGAVSLRHAGIIANCVSAIAFARFLETGDPAWLKALDYADDFTSRAHMQFSGRTLDAMIVLDRLAARREAAA